MKHFNCTCGQRIFFENTQCVTCGRRLGFDPEWGELLAFDTVEQSHWFTAAGTAYKPCRNNWEYQVCNWVLPAQSDRQYCLACDLNEMVPTVTVAKKRVWWGNMETAKRRLLFTLLRLQLPVISRRDSPEGLAFAFLEDQRTNPLVEEEFVETGHAQGLITVNLAEADDASRERTRVKMREKYRTLLGHFRHESGHYYFDLLVKPGIFLQEFRTLFGDDSRPYQQALKAYYQNPPPPAWQTGFISDYAQSHPLEDWAECWAHYLHMVDTLETAAQFGLVDCDPFTQPIDQWLPEWSRVSEILNELNRSMGFRDAYPFALSRDTRAKIRFVHRVIAGPR